MPRCPRHRHSGDEDAGRQDERCKQPAFAVVMFHVGSPDRTGRAGPRTQTLEPLLSTETRFGRRTRHSPPKFPGGVGLLGIAAGAAAGSVCGLQQREFGVIRAAALPVRRPGPLPTRRGQHGIEARPRQGRRPRGCSARPRRARARVRARHSRLRPRSTAPLPRHRSRFPASRRAATPWRARDARVPGRSRAATRSVPASHRRRLKASAVCPAVASASTRSG